MREKKKTIGSGKQEMGSDLLWKSENIILQKKVRNRKYGREVYHTKGVGTQAKEKIYAIWKRKSNEGRMSYQKNSKSAMKKRETSKRKLAFQKGGENFEEGMDAV